MIPAVRAAAAPFVGFHSEGGAVVEGEDVGEGDVGDVSAFEDCGVFFRRAVLVEDDVVVQVVGVHGWFFSLRLLVVMSTRGCC